MPNNLDSIWTDACGRALPGPHPANQRSNRVLAWARGWRNLLVIPIWVVVALFGYDLYGTAWMRELAVASGVVSVLQVGVLIWAVRAEKTYDGRRATYVSLTSPMWVALDLAAIFLLVNILLIEPRRLVGHSLWFLVVVFVWGLWIDCGTVRRTRLWRPWNRQH